MSVALNEELISKSLYGLLCIQNHLISIGLFVKGPQFLTLHAKFEELYNEEILHMVRIAEGLLTLVGPSCYIKITLNAFMRGTSFGYVHVLHI